MELGKRYIYTVYCEKSFSRAAEKLFVSQSSLSSSVIKEEKKLGFSVFDRSHSPITLTPEGEIFIEYLKDTIDAEKIMNQRIKSLTEQEYNNLSVGGASSLARELLPKICEIFHKKFPAVNLMVDLGEKFFYSYLLEKINSDNINFVIGYHLDPEKHSAIPLLEERYIVAARKDLSNIKPLLPYSLTREEILSGKDFSTKEITDHTLFENIIFLHSSSNSITTRELHDFLKNLTFSSPYVYNTRKDDIYYELMLSGLGAIITTDFTVSCYKHSSNIAYFLANFPVKSRQAKIIYKKGKILSELEKEFISITCNLFKSKPFYYNNHLYK